MTARIKSIGLFLIFLLFCYGTSITGSREEAYCFSINNSIRETQSIKGESTFRYSISGSVKDLSTGRVLPGAIVKVIDTSGNTTVTTATSDITGSYITKIASPGEYVLSGIKTGYDDYVQTEPPFMLTDASPAKESMVYMTPSGGDTIFLKPGWNFISFPRLPSNPSPIDRVLKDVSPAVRIVWGYDNIDKLWLKFSPAVSSSILASIEFGKGYWVYMNTQGTISLAPWPTPSATYMNLYPGWNLIGHHGANDAGIDSVLSGISGKWSLLWNWDNGQWYGKHTEISTLPAPIQPLATLNQGKAYWVKMNKRATLTDENYTLGTQQILPVGASGQSLASMLDGMGVQNHWLRAAGCASNCYLVNWQTGDVSGNLSPQPDCTASNFMKVTEGDTFCSSFVSAVVWKSGTTLGTKEIPFLHPFNSKYTAAYGSDGQCAPRDYLSDYQQDWLQGKTPAIPSGWDYGTIPSGDGWKALQGDSADSMVNAQNYANQGYLVVASYKYPLFAQGNKKPGHVTVVYPMEKDPGVISTEGPEVISAGWDNSPKTSLKDAYKHHSCYYANSLCQAGTTCGTTSTSSCNDPSGNPVGSCAYCQNDSNGNPMGAWESMQGSNPYVLFFYYAIE